MKAYDGDGTYGYARGFPVVRFLALFFIVAFNGKQNTDNYWQNDLSLNTTCY